MNISKQFEVELIRKEKSSKVMERKEVFDTWYEAVAYAQKTRVWGKVEVVEKPDGKYVLNEHKKENN